MKNRLEVTQQLQLCLDSFFIEHPKDFVKPTVPVLYHVIVYVIEPTSSTNVSILSPISNTLVNNLLTDLERAISNLPNISITGELAIFSNFFPTDINQDDMGIHL